MNSGIERQRAHFNSIAKRYVAGREDGNHRRVKSLIWQSALTCLRPLQGRKIRMLEPMCGHAEGLEIARDIAGLDCDYSGFDYSDVMVEELSRSFSEGKVWQADVTTYTPEPESFDLVMLIGGLHHVPDSAALVVQNVSQALRPGGMFVSFEPTSGNPVFKLIRDRIYDSNDIFDEATERAFSVAELKGFFLSAGLEEVRVIFPGLIAYVMYYNTYAFPYLNIGGARMVKSMYAVDRLFMGNWIGRIFSFATISVWRRPA